MKERTKVLWIANIATTLIAQQTNAQMAYGGGWLANLSIQLAKIDNMELAYAFPVNADYTGKVADDVIIHINTNNLIHCYAVPMNKGTVKPSHTVEKRYKEIIRDFKPDVIHVWGTEYVHSYSAMCASKACGLLERTVVSIQGLVSVYARHYLGYIETIKLRPTLRNVLKRDGIFKQQEDFVKRGVFEIEAIKMANHIIGRTDWDKACTEQINREAEYHFCNETLREPFYKKNWSIETCERHSIFVSQCQYPIKGLHMLLEAMPEILGKYPDTHIYTTGKDRLQNGFINRLKRTEYDRYLNEIVEKYHLESHISFLGSLNEEQMCKQFYKSHVFVSPSSVENSPNSVGEAMILGIPTVTSDVGGVKNMLVHGKEGYVYQPDAPYMLAYYVMKIFEDDMLAVSLSENAKKHARDTHDPGKNLKELLRIYEKLSRQK